MTLWWIGNIVLVVVIFPVVVYLLRGVLAAAKRVASAVEAIDSRWAGDIQGP